MIWYKFITRKDPPCPFCQKAKELLDLNGIDYWEVDITEPGIKEMFAERGFKTVPQIFIEDRHLGGYLALEQHLKELNIEKEKQHRTRGKPTVTHTA